MKRQPGRSAGLFSSVCRLSLIGHGTEYRMREQGSRDWRLLPVACTAWITVLLVRTFFRQAHPGLDRPGSKSARIAQTDGLANQGLRGGYWWSMTGLLLAIMLSMGLFLFACGRRRKSPEGRNKARSTAMEARNIDLDRSLSGVRTCLPGITVVGAAVMVMTVVTLVSQVSEQAGPAYRQVMSGKAQAEIQGRLVSPAKVSERRGWDCRAKLDMNFIVINGVGTPTSEEAVVYARGKSCQMAMAGRYRVSGLLVAATFGQEPLWVEVQEGTKAEELERPGFLHRLVNRMQESFLAQTRPLSDQGRVLVPGLTMGMLGSEGIVFDEWVDGRPAQVVEPVYAARLKEDFRRSGILHLMAVSGGHFMILAAGLTRLMRALRSPPLLTGVVLAGSYLGLGLIMVPSDSVLRAQTMGLMAAMATACRRRSQSINALSWCVILTLVLKPSMASSFGFTLSAAAVLGISMLGEAILDRLVDHMPTLLAEPLAMTLAAEAGTLPIQILMSQQISLFSPLANLIVAPVVDFATISGLAGMMISWFCPGAGHLLAWVSSWGTGVMEVGATWLGESNIGTLAWPPGGLGILSLVLVEVGILLCVHMIRFTGLLGLDPDQGDMGGVGVPFRPSTWFKAERWLRQTREQVSSMRFASRGNPDKGS